MAWAGDTVWKAHVLCHCREEGGGRKSVALLLSTYGVHGPPNGIACPRRDNNSPSKHSCGNGDGPAVHFFSAQPRFPLATTAPPPPRPAADPDFVPILNVVAVILPCSGGLMGAAGTGVGYGEEFHFVLYPVPFLLMLRLYRSNVSPPPPPPLRCLPRVRLSCRAGASGAPAGFWGVWVFASLSRDGAGHFGTGPRMIML